MATRRPAKLAINKKVQETKHCPECENEMQIAQLIRVSGPSGMFWLCENRSCNTLLTTANAPAGTLELK
jgi:hypothetical protein